MLYGMGHVPARINREDIPQETTFALSQDDAGLKGVLRTRERTVPLEDV
jgi:hypothetical protein